MHFPIFSLIKITLSDQALRYIEEKPKARELLQLLRTDCPVVIGVWTGLEASLREYTGPKCRVLYIGTGEPGRAFCCVYAGEKAEKAEKRLDRLVELGVLARFCANSQVYHMYALYGEWTPDNGTSALSMDLAEREYIHRLLASGKYTN